MASGYPLEAGKGYPRVNEAGVGSKFRDLDIFRHVDLETLSQRCLGWIANGEDIIQNTSIIALLTSQNFATALQGHLDPSLISNLQDFLLSTTLAYTSWRDPHPQPQRLSVRDLYRISHLTGSALLQELDRLLQAGSLISSPRSTLLAKFLLIFGTTLGVTYATSIGSGRPEIQTDLLSKVLKESPTLWMAMKERLCHLLADSFVSLSSTLQFQFDAELAKSRVIDGCLMGRWHHIGRFVWASRTLSPPWQQSLPIEGGVLVTNAGGAFIPTPQAIMMPRAELLSPVLPSMDGSDGGKRRSMLVIGPSGDGQQMYARARSHTGSDGPSLFV
ncbi:hypothetical protein SLS53_001661 [Cytospora paraplurivora]|uniref:Uncharacterized protein n=1 Tax=Cytospora paraplurivora TaxID=2898453 RepID=A0AAN9UI51_9PEZI